MPVTIRCPDCLRQYTVSDHAVGKSVVCANKECGIKFVATEIDEPRSDMKSHVVQSAKPSRTRKPPVLPSAVRPRSESSIDVRSLEKVQRSSSEVTLRKWVLLLAIFSVVEALALCLLSALYLAGGSHPPTQTTQSSERQPQSIATEERATQSTGPAPSASDVIENREFTQTLGEYLAFSHRMLKLIRLTSGLNTPVKYDFVLEGVRQRGSKISMPSHFSDPAATLRSVRDIEDAVTRCVSMTELAGELNPRSREEILAAVGSGLSREVPQKLISELADISRRIEDVATSNGISRDELVGSKRFRASVLDLIGQIRTQVARLNKRPLVPEMFDRLSIPSNYRLTIGWSTLPEPAESIPHRQKLLDDINQLYTNTYLATFIHDESAKNNDALTNEDFTILRQKADALCEEALKLADGLQDQIKDL